MVVDNFLGTAANRRLLALIEQSADVFAPGEISNHGSIAVDVDFKRNKNIWRDLFESEIVHMFQNRLFNFNAIDPLLDHKNKSY